MTFRPLPILTAATLAALALLLALGQWQWTRFTEKRANAEDVTPVAEIGPITAVLGGGGFVYGVHAGRPGWRALVPVRVAGEAATVFVDAAFLPGPETPTANAETLAPPVGAKISGVWSRPQRRGPFTPAPDLARRAFFTADPALLALPEHGTVAPSLFLAAYPDGPNPFQPGADPLPPERHFGYALTWWGLAAALVAVYAAYHARRGRLRLRTG